MLNFVDRRDGRLHRRHALPRLGRRRARARLDDLRGPQALDHGRADGAAARDAPAPRPHRPDDGGGGVGVQRLRARLARPRPRGRRALHVEGQDARLVLWAPDYDGGHKAWVRWPDGKDDIVPGSQRRALATPAAALRRRPAPRTRPPPGRRRLRRRRGSLPAATARSVCARRWRNEPSKRLCLRAGSKRAPRDGQPAANGQTSQRGTRARQTVAPRSISASAERQLNSPPLRSTMRLTLTSVGSTSRPNAKRPSASAV